MFFCFHYCLYRTNYSSPLNIPPDGRSSLHRATCVRFARGRCGRQYQPLLHPLQGEVFCQPFICRVDCLLFHPNSQFSFPHFGERTGWGSQLSLKRLIQHGYDLLVGLYRPQQYHPLAGSQPPRLDSGSRRQETWFLAVPYCTYSTKRLLLNHNAAKI